MVTNNEQISEVAFYKLLLQAANDNLQLRLIDIILFRKREPVIWMFTDTKEYLSAKSLANMSIDNLIKAIICNINSIEGKIEHQDILVTIV